MTIRQITIPFGSRELAKVVLDGLVGIAQFLYVIAAHPPNVAVAYVWEYEDCMKMLAAKGYALS